jgi:4-diphosphocytidyl-2-C-methyl-D-erythritol kinase
VSLRVRAPGKVNLCLCLGPRRPDGRHELVTVLESVSLADKLLVSTTDDPAGSTIPRDTVLCNDFAGAGDNLVAVALKRLREAGWRGPPLHVQLQKRIPVAGGMGGGSADAAAILRVARELEPWPEQAVRELAAELGADVPSQLAPGLALGTGAGELVAELPPLAAHALLILPQPHELSTAEVYAEADRLGLGHDHEGVGRMLAELKREFRPGARPPVRLLVNDLQPAALSLLPRIEVALEAAQGSGADHALVSGSGPTVFALFWGEDAAARASEAHAHLRGRFPYARTAVPVGPDFGRPSANT